MKPLPIVWQRLVSAAGATCPRCQGTHEEVQRAVERLKVALAPLGIMPALEIRELGQTAFLNQPSESNRIWICGKPMEEWVEGRVGGGALDVELGLGKPMEEWVEGRVGRSRCCGECGDQDCRTVEVGGTTYEVIPEALLVRAGLIAASRLLDPTLAS